MKVLAPVSELSDVVLVEVGDESEGGGEAEDQSSDQSVEDLPVPHIFDPLNLSRRKVNLLHVLPDKPDLADVDISEENDPDWEESVDAGHEVSVQATITLITGPPETNLTTNVMKVQDNLMAAPP